MAVDPGWQSSPLLGTILLSHLFHRAFVSKRLRNIVLQIAQPRCTPCSTLSFALTVWKGRHSSGSWMDVSKSPERNKCVEGSFFFFFSDTGLDASEITPRQNEGSDGNYSLNRPEMKRACPFPFLSWNAASLLHFHIPNASTWCPLTLAKPLCHWPSNQPKALLPQEVKKRFCESHWGQTGWFKLSSVQPKTTCASSPCLRPHLPSTGRIKGRGTGKVPGTWLPFSYYSSIVITGWRKPSLRLF